MQDNMYVSKLENVQQFAARIATGHQSISSDDLCTQLQGWPPLSGRRKFQNSLSVIESCLVVPLSHESHSYLILLQTWLAETVTRVTFHSTNLPQEPKLIWALTFQVWFPFGYVVVILECALQGWTFEWLEIQARINASVSLVYLFIAHLVFVYAVVVRITVKTFSVSR